MTGPRLYIDIDDVLAETTRALADTARTRFGKNIPFQKMTTFDLRISLQLQEDEYESFMLEVHKPEFLRALAPTVDAPDVLDAWKKSGARIELVTGRPPSSQQATIDWLEDHSIAYDSLEFIDKYRRYSGEPTKQLSDLSGRNYRFAIEDSASVAIYLAENTSSRVLLYDRPWNQSGPLEDGPIKRVHSWREILEKVQL